jgi:tetratricopeptide (TPR) repeat protein
LERWVEPLLERDLIPLSRARVLSALISIAAQRQDAARLQAHGDELLPLSRAIGADALTCSALLALGSAAFLRGDVEEGRGSYREAIDLARTTRPTMVPVLLGNLGWLLRAASELAEAREILDEAVELGRREGSPYLLSRSLSGRANLALDEREFPEALALYHEALGFCRDFAIRSRVPICLGGISAALVGLGRHEKPPESAVQQTESARR